MNKFDVGDVVIWCDDLYKVTRVYNDGTLKLQSIRGKANSVFYHIHPDYVKKRND